MKKVWTIFRFTFRMAVRKKAFKIATLLMVLGILIMSMIPRINETIAKRKEEIQLKAQQTMTEEPASSNDKVIKTELVGICYYLDEDNLIPGGREALSNYMPNIGIIQGNKDDAAKYRTIISQDSTVSFIWVSRPDETEGPALGALPKINILTQNILNGVSESDVREILSRAYISSLLTKGGVDSDLTSLLQIQLPTEMTNTTEVELTGYIIALIVVALIFFGVYYYGYSVAVSIADEKSSRVMEALAVTARPWQIILGKLLAVIVLGALQILMVMAVAAVSFRYLVPEGYSLLGMSLSLKYVTIQRAIITAAYAVLGLLLYGALNTICGAAVSKIQDLNSSLMPVVLIAMASFILSCVAALGDLDIASKTRIVISILPVTSPFYMPFRVLGGSASIEEIIASMTVLMIFIVLSLIMAIFVYRKSLLHYDRKIRIKDVLKSSHDRKRDS